MTQHSIHASWSGATVLALSLSIVFGCNQGHIIPVDDLDGGTVGEDAANDEGNPEDAGTETHSDGNVDDSEDTPSDLVTDGNADVDEQDQADEIQPFDGASFYVAKNGDDDNPGTFLAPFATLERARQAVRDLKQEHGIPNDGLTVAIREGVYFFSESFILEEQDSGEPERPITWMAYPHESVRLTGAVRLEPGWLKPVDNGDPLWDRLDAMTRDHIVKLDLAAMGIRDYGSISRRGFKTGWSQVHSALELFMNGVPMELARWPNRGQTDFEDPGTDAVVSGDIFGEGTTFICMGPDASGNADDGYPNYSAVVNGKDYYLYHCTWPSGGATHGYWFISTHDPVSGPSCWPSGDTSWLASGEWPMPPLSAFGGSAAQKVIPRTRAVDFADHGFLRTIDSLGSTSFTFPGSRYQRWTQADDIWFQGLFNTFWADDSLPGVIGPDGVVTLAEEPSFGLASFRPFFVFNLAEELDAPGEWWLDRNTGVLYFYPPHPLAEADLAVSLLEDPILLVWGASHLRFVDLTLEHGRGTLVQAEGAQDATWQGCTMRGSGSDAVEIQGNQSGLDHCRVMDSGGDAVSLKGGDRPGLTPGGLFVRNSELARFGRWDRTYNVAVKLEGVGNVAEHNFMHDAPHAAIQFTGNDHRIEYNRIERVVQEASDAGAIYTGRDWGYRGNLIRHNLFVHIGGMFGGAVGVYLDDASSGITVFGNIIYDVQGLGTQSGGGRDNHFENNIIVGAAHSAHSTDRRGTTANYDFEGSGRPDDWNLLGRVNWVYDPWNGTRIYYQEKPWALSYPELAAIPNDWQQVQGSHWLEPEGCTFANNVIWRSGGMVFQGSWGGEGALDFYTRSEPNLETDPLFVDEANGDFHLRADSPVFNTTGFAFQPIPVDQIGIQ